MALRGASETRGRHHSPVSHIVIGAGALFLAMLWPVAGEPIDERISFDAFRAQLELQVEEALRKYRVPGAAR